MASNQPYSLDDLMARIHTLVDNDADTPTSTDEEYETRINLINQAVGKWESQDTFWDELWTTYTHGSTVALGDKDYTLTSLTDMRYPGGYVELVLNGSTSYYEIISPEQYQTFQGEARVVYFTGNNRSGWTLNLGWTPADGDGTVGATIKIPYYKYAQRFTVADLSTVKPEMSDPNYIVYDVAAAKSLLESKNNQYSVYSVEALNCLDRMKAVNEARPYANPLRIEDIDDIAYGAVLGE